MNGRTTRFSARRTWAIAHRDLLSLFVSPVGYVSGALFLLLQGYNFSLLLRVLNDPLAAPGPVMQYFFGGSFFIFWLPVVFLCATISMRSLASERMLGTMESLITAPSLADEIVVGKFIAAVGFYVVMWLPTLTFYLLLLGANAHPELGPILAGYLGTFCVGISFLSIGILASAATRSQLAAAIGSFVSCCVLLLSGLLVDQVESTRGIALLELTSQLAFMQEVAQGIIDVRRIVVSVALTIGCLAAATMVLRTRGFRGQAVHAGLALVALLGFSAFFVRHAPRLDVTSGRVFSLSSAGEAFLETIDEPVSIRVIVPSTIGAGKQNPLALELREVLIRMQRVSSSLSVEFLDPDQDRQRTAELLRVFSVSGPQAADGVVLVSAGQGGEQRREHLFAPELVEFSTDPDVQITGPRVKAFLGESSVLTAIARVLDPRLVKICGIRGHGAPEFDGLEPYGGYAHLRDLLGRGTMTFETIRIDSHESIQDCDVVLIAGPKLPYGPAQVDALSAFAKKGGAFLMLVGAVVTPGTKQLAPTGLDSLLGEFGVRLGNRVILDPERAPGMTPLLAFTLDSGFAQHSITRSLLGRPLTLSLVREVELLRDETGARAEAVVETSDDSWAESDLMGLADWQGLTKDDNGDEAGPFPVVIAASNGASKLVLLASDQFALNAYLRPDLDYDAGRALLVSSVRWLTDRNVVSNVVGRRREHIKLLLKPAQLNRMTLVCLLGLPGFWALLGGWVLWRRRRQ